MAVSASEVEKLETTGNPKPRVHYTDEFRAEAVEYYRKAKELDPKKTIRACAADLGLNDKTPDDWVVRFGRSGGLDRGKDDAQKQIDQLQKEVKELKLENEFLKKPQPSTP